MLYVYIYTSYYMCVAYNIAIEISSHGEADEELETPSPQAGHEHWGSTI